LNMVSLLLDQKAHYRLASTDAQCESESKRPSTTLGEQHWA